MAVERVYTVSGIFRMSGGSEFQALEPVKWRHRIYYRDTIAILWV